MARLKNTAFSGAAMHDVEPGAASYRRVLREAIEDTALIYDKATGENAEADTIIHTGASGRGALLGIPLACQSVGRSLALTGATGSFAVVAVPFFLPTGETSVTVDAFFQFGGGVFNTPRLIVRDTSFNADADVNMAQVSEGHFSATADGLTAGLNLLFVIVDENFIESDGTLQTHFIGWRMHYGRLREEVSSADVRRNSSNDDTPNPYSITRTASVGIAHTNFDESLLSDAYPYSGYLTANLNRNLNVLQEAGSGWPVGGNATYTQIDNSAGVADDVNPGVSQFFAHTRSYFTSEPLCEFTVLVESVGACRDDGAWATNITEPPTSGMLGYYAPWPKLAAPTSANKIVIRLPDFPTGTSNLKAAIMGVGAATGEATNWTGGITTSAGSATDAFGAVTGSGGLVYLSEPVAIPFNADTTNTVEVTFARSGSKAKTDEIAFTGWCLYFDP